MKKLTTIKLLGILALLVGIYFIVDVMSSKSKSGTLRATLVTIDSASVTKMQILTAVDTVVLTKESEGWKLALANGKLAPANEGTITNAINALMGIKPSRMATKNPEKWQEYQVDSAGTRVQVFQGTEITLDIILGRFGMKDQRSFYTFVKLAEDNEVYVADNFMGFSVPKDAAAYRNQVLTKIDKNIISTVSLTYPADTSVILSRVGGGWTINGTSADSTSVDQYLSALANVSGRTFMNEPERLTVPVITADIAMQDGSKVLIEAYQHNGTWVYHSSQNQEGYFTDPSIQSKVFKGRSAF